MQLAAAASTSSGDDATTMRVWRLRRKASRQKEDNGDEEAQERSDSSLQHHRWLLPSFLLSRRLFSLRRRPAAPLITATQFGAPNRTERPNERDTTHTHRQQTHREEGKDINKVQTHSVCAHMHALSNRLLIVSRTCVRGLRFDGACPTRADACSGAPVSHPCTDEEMSSLHCPPRLISFVPDSPVTVLPPNRFHPAGALCGRDTTVSTAV